MNLNTVFKRNKNSQEIALIMFIVLVIKEIKTAWRFHLTPVRLANKTADTEVGEDLGNQKLSLADDGNAKLVPPLWR